MTCLFYMKKEALSLDPNDYDIYLLSRRALIMQLLLMKQQFKINMNPDVYQ